MLWNIIGYGLLVAAILGGFAGTVFLYCVVADLLGWQEEK